MGHDPLPLIIKYSKFKSTRGEMNAGLIMIILRIASERRDAQNERDGAGLRSSVAAATLSQLRVAVALQPRTQLVVPSLLEVLPAAPRGHKEGRDEDDQLSARL